MWQRKTASEIRSDRLRERVNPAPALFMALLSAVLGFCLGLISWTDKFGRPHHAHSVTSSAIIALEFFVLVFVVLYVITLLTGGPFGSDRSKTFICTACQSVQARSENGQCSCGGPLEPLEKWKWIPDVFDQQT